RSSCLRPSIYLFTRYCHIHAVVPSLFFFGRWFVCRFSRVMGQKHSLPSFGFSVGTCGLAMCVTASVWHSSQFGLRFLCIPFVALRLIHSKICQFVLLFESLISEHSKSLCLCHFRFDCQAIRILKSLFQFCLKFGQIDNSALSQIQRQLSD